MAKVVKSGGIILPSVSPKNDKKDKHFAIFDIFQETKSEIFDKREKTGCNTCRFI